MARRNEAAVFNQEETVNAWDEDYYHPVAVRYYDAAIPSMLREMGVGREDHVLDAGCGPGVHSIRAAAFGCKVTAIDLSSTMLRHAVSRAKAAGFADRIDFRQCDITKPDLGEVYDFVFSWGVVIHVPETKRALDGLSTLVAPGGKLALQILNANSFDYRVERYFRGVLKKPFEEQVDTPFGPANWYTLGDERLWVLRFNMSALDAVMSERGFKLLSRRTAEFSEMQRRLPSLLRRPLLRLNSYFFRHRIGSNLSATQIVIYQRNA